MYILFFIGSAVLCSALVFLVRSIALSYGFIDRPDKVRKRHDKPVPLLGGVALALAFWLVVLCLVFFFPQSLFVHIKPQQLVGLFIGSCLVVGMGAFDDKYSISPQLRLGVIILAALIVVGSGISIQEITHPLGGVIKLDFWTLPGLGKKIGALPFVIITLWLVGMMHTTKILDGLDGLATGIVFIGAMMIFVLSSLTRFYQPDVAVLSMVFAGVLSGFLIWNFYPAKIFLGEGGSIFIGLILGALAVIAGGKIATALLVMGVPILDLGRVIIIRLRRGRSLFVGDREHLHFLLLDRGFSQRAVVLFLYGTSLVFGVTTFFLQSVGKLIMLLLLAVLMFGGSFFIHKPR